ncbi:MAG TPA: periplasmic heavy metal sensor [Stellaceae bacterium]|jgi:Spy/CpxP family protein refolding chaperone|nr:periplasmic heavy metal sensor [Stellaceae bacterium]
MTDVAGARPPRRRWPVIVALTVSVALNLFFVGVIAGSMSVLHHGGNVHDRFEQIVGEMALSPGQRAAFRDFQATLRQHGAAMHRANMAIWSKIADPSTGQDQIAALLDSTVQNRTKFQQDVVASLEKFLAALTPEQRAAFVSKARNTPHPHGPLHRLHELLH